VHTKTATPAGGGSRGALSDGFGCEDCSCLGACLEQCFLDFLEAFLFDLFLEFETESMFLGGSAAAAAASGRVKSLC
jgi:hypothetical protein